MAAQKRGLGKGLDALLGGGNAPAAVTSITPGAAAPAGDQPQQEVPVDLIDRSPYQPRREFDPEKLAELAQSIVAQGVIQPVVVRRLDSGRYELIAGERRWRAAQIAGLASVPVVVRAADDGQAMAMALIENIQREDLSPLEQANALKRLLDEFGMTHQEIAQAVGRSRAAVSNLIRLLDLNEDVKQLLTARALEMGHGRALLGLAGGAQSEAAAVVARKGLSVRQTEALVRRLSRPATATPPPAQLDPDVRRLQDDMAEMLGASVKIKPGKKGRGSIVIDYHSLDELDGILKHIS